MKNILWLVICIVSLSSPQEETKITMNDPLTEEMVTYSLCLPKGYKQKTIITPPEGHSYESVLHLFHYRNGATLYIGNSASVINHKHVMGIIGKDSPYEYLVDNVFLRDSIQVSQTGIPTFWDYSDKTCFGKYWRDVQCYSWIIGYNGVPKRDLNVFNSIVNAFIEARNVVDGR